MLLAAAPPPYPQASRSSDTHHSYSSDYPHGPSTGRNGSEGGGQYYMQSSAHTSGHPGHKQGGLTLRNIVEDADLLEGLRRTRT
jgi:hypothetical protein